MRLSVPLSSDASRAQDSPDTGWAPTSALLLGNQKTNTPESTPSLPPFSGLQHSLCLFKVYEIYILALPSFSESCFEKLKSNMQNVKYCDYEHLICCRTK